MGKPKGGTNLNHSKEKKLTQIKQLEYKVALLARELLKKDGDIVRLKNP